MLTATFLAPFLIPMFYVVVAEKVAREKRAPEAASGPASPAPPQVPAEGS